jgi:hypothetical protein
MQIQVFQIILLDFMPNAAVPYFRVVLNASNDYCSISLYGHKYHPIITTETIYYQVQVSIILSSFLTATVYNLYLLPSTFIYYLVFSESIKFSNLLQRVEESFAQTV